jgi:hypothetical protein
VVYGGLWWFVWVCGGLRGFAEVYGGLRGFTEVYNGSCKLIVPCDVIEDLQWLV